MNEVQQQAELIKEHQKKHPRCTEATCTHLKPFVGMVIFHEPDNGFIATIQAFDKKTALMAFKNGVAAQFPHLHVKRMEVDVDRAGIGKMNINNRRSI